MTELPATALASSAIGRVGRRLVPFVFLLYVVNYLDRVNVSFAALQMNRDLGFSSSQYGLGAGIFFLGYVLFQVPANLLLVRFGARRWIATIMITWGCLSGLMMFIHRPVEFYLLRVLLGFAEAGFFPGVILYLTQWFPAAARARAVATFMTAIPISAIVGAPLSGALLGMSGVAGLAGWRWLFLCEALPALLLGAAAFWYLTDRPAEAEWLPPAEREWLLAELARERPQGGGSDLGALRQVVSDSRFWVLGLLWWLLIAGLYGVSLWLPQMVRALSRGSDFTVALLSAIPSLAAVASMVLVARSSDRAGERFLHIAGSAAIAAVGLLGAAMLHSLPLVLASFCLAYVATGTYGPFWTLPPRFVGGRNTAAPGIAFINSIGNLGGFIGPYLLGWVRQRTAGFAGGLLPLAASAGAAAVLALVIRRVPGFNPGRAETA